MTVAENRTSESLQEISPLAKPVTSATNAADAEPAEKWSTGQLLRNRNFLLLWLG